MKVLVVEDDEKVAAAVVRGLERVATASAAFDAARDAFHQAVRAALDDGASWSEIGGVLGVSRQAAFQRFGPKQGRREAGMIDP